MIHIVFQHDDVALLKDAMQLDETLQGEIFEIKDEWGVGPLQNLDETEGWNQRLEWWRGLLKNSPYENILGSFDDRNTVSAIKETLNNEPGAEAWIWMGQNQHDVTGYYWLMRQLREYQGRVMVIYLNNLPFINEKGQIFYPWAISEVLPKEMVKAKKLSRPITLCIYQQIFLPHIHQCISNTGIAMWMVLHSLTNDIGNFIITPIIHFFHGMKNTSLHWLQPIYNCRNGSFKNYIRCVIQKPGFILTMQSRFILSHISY